MGMNRNQLDKIKGYLKESDPINYSGDPLRIEIDLAYLSKSMAVDQKAILLALYDAGFIDDHYPDSGKAVDLVFTEDGERWLRG